MDAVLRLLSILVGDLGARLWRTNLWFRGVRFMGALVTVYGSIQTLQGTI
ncbi:hypothetical protein [Azospirillum argentinense]